MLADGEKRIKPGPTSCRTSWEPVISERRHFSPSESVIDVQIWIFEGLRVRNQGDFRSFSVFFADCPRARRLLGWCCSQSVLSHPGGGVHAVHCQT